MQRAPLVDSRPRMNTRFGARPTDGCMTVNDGWKAGWEGSGTRRRGQGESGSCMSDDARTEIQCASQTPPTPQYNSPDLPSLPLAHPPDFPVQNLPDLHHPIRFQGDAELVANGPRIASATAGHSASIPRSLSAVRIILFTFLARHAEPLPFGRIWRTPDPPEMRQKCVTGLPAEPSADASLRAPTVASLDASAHQGSASGRPRHPPWTHHLVHRPLHRLVHRMTRQWLRRSFARRRNT
jgi:hypothetical protein